MPDFEFRAPCERIDGKFPAFPVNWPFCLSSALEKVVIAG